MNERTSDWICGLNRAFEAWTILTSQFDFVGLNEAPSSNSKTCMGLHGYMEVCWTLELPLDKLY